MDPPARQGAQVKASDITWRELGYFTGIIAGICLVMLAVAVIARLASEWFP